MPRKNKTNLSQAQFIEIFNTSDSYDEIVHRTGLNLGYIQVRAWKLRKSGIELKYFPLNRRTGLIGWLKEKYPDVYQDLRENYTDIYNATNGSDK